MLSWFKDQMRNSKISFNSHYSIHFWCSNRKVDPRQRRMIESDSNKCLSLISFSKFSTNFSSKIWMITIHSTWISCITTQNTFILDFQLISSLSQSFNKFQYPPFIHRRSTNWIFQRLIDQIRCAYSSGISLMMS